MAPNFSDSLGRAAGLELALEMQIVLLHDDDSDLTEISQLISLNWRAYQLLNHDSIASLLHRIDWTKTTRAPKFLPDLIIIDFTAAKYEYTMLTRALRDDPHIEYLPLILLTQPGLIDELPPHLSERADAILKKPVARSAYPELRQIGACGVMGVSPYPSEQRPGFVG